MAGYRRESTHPNDMQRYEFKWACRSCGHKWKRTIATDDPLSIVDPPCPACKKRQKQEHEFNINGRPPAMIGGNDRVRAADQAAEIIMQDHGLTDIKGVTDVREGESSAPKLPGRLQQMADNMFQPQKQMQGVGMGHLAGRVAQSAMSGGYSPAFTGAPDPIAMAQAPRKTVADVANVMNPGGG